MSSITITTPELVYENPKTVKKMNREIAYAKKLEAFVHEVILREIEVAFKHKHADEMSRQDLQGLQENIFTCIKEVDQIIERYHKNTDNIDLLLNLISIQNKIFSNVLTNGTLRGNKAKFCEKHLENYQLENAECDVAGTYYDGARD
jgi:hypothetical protein